MLVHALRCRRRDCLRLTRRPRPALLRFWGRVDCAGRNRAWRRFSYAAALYCTRPAIYQHVSDWNAFIIICLDYKKTRQLASLSIAVWKEVSSVNFQGKTRYNMTISQDTSVAHCFAMLFSMFVMFYYEHLGDLKSYTDFLLFQKKMLTTILPILYHTSDFIVIFPRLFNTVVCILDEDINSSSFSYLPPSPSPLWFYVNIPLNCLHINMSLHIFIIAKLC